MNSHQLHTISVVGVAPEFAENVITAIGALRMRGLILRLQEWDGTRRSIVIASTENPLGEAAIRLTRQRGGIAIPVSRHLSNDASCLLEQSGVDRIREVLSVKCQALAPRSVPQTNIKSAGFLPGGGLGLICEQAQHPSEFLLQRGNHDILVSHRNGRVITSSTNHVGLLKSKLLDDDWVVINDDRAIHEFYDLRDLVSTSLEAMLVESCIGHRNRLPPQPAGRVSIEHLPDVASINDQGESLLMAAKLKQGFEDVAQAAETIRVEKSKLNAMIWAMAASGLLQRGAAKAPAEGASESARTPSATSSLIRRLAARFGFAGGMHA